MPSTRARMAATGIGYAGIDGPWWLPAAAPYRLPSATARTLDAIAGAVFALFDAVDQLYDTAAGARSGLDALLEHKVPAALMRWRSPQPVLAVRPDFQLLPQSDGYGLAATELEIAPSAQGFAHAMELGYGLGPGLARAYAAMLAGRELLIVCAGAWSEFLFDQLAFCRALAEAGATARVLCDTAPATLQAEIAAGLRWQPPMFGVPVTPAGWQPDLLARAARGGLAPFLGPAPEAWPAEVGDAVIFRFGYLNSFAPTLLERLQRWERGGAHFLNPLRFYLDSKAVLAALGLPAVRERVGAEALRMLDRCIPETLLLDPASAAQVRAERAGWVLKFAGFDQGEAAWGGRSLQVGGAHNDTTWGSVVESYLQLPWPVVAQRVTPSAQLRIDYLEQGELVQPFQGTARLRAFLLRHPAAAAHGAHLTIAGSSNVAESTGSVQAPLRFSAE